jgi:hypothetical protein
MGLLSFFKKKNEPETTQVPGDSIKALTDGILFEGENIFLKWGADIEADKQYAKKEFRADRVIYQWGEKTILKGLKLPFKTVCWNQKQHGNIISFEAIEFFEEGDGTTSTFEAIEKHLGVILGEPKQNTDMQPGEAYLEWKIKAVKVALTLINKDQPKMHLEIGWWV